MASSGNAPWRASHLFLRRTANGSTANHTENLVQFFFTLRCVFDRPNPPPPAPSQAPPCPVSGELSLVGGHQRALPSSCTILLGSRRPWTRPTVDLLLCGRGRETNYTSPARFIGKLRHLCLLFPCQIPSTSPDLICRYFAVQFACTCTFRAVLCVTFIVRCLLLHSRWRRATVSHGDDETRAIPA